MIKKKRDFLKILAFFGLSFTSFFAYNKFKPKINDKFTIKISRFKKIDQKSHNSNCLVDKDKNIIHLFYDFKRDYNNKGTHIIKNDIKYKSAPFNFNLNQFKTGLYNIKISSNDNNYNSDIIINPTFKNKGDILVIIPDYTQQAYNTALGSSLYKKPINREGSHYENWVFSMRPKIQGMIFDMYYRYKGLNSLIKSDDFTKKFKIDYISEIYLTKNMDKYDLGNYKLIVLFGHNEYWTKEFSNYLSSSIYKGTNLLNLSGNTFWRLLKDDNLYINRSIFGIDDNNSKLLEELLGVSFKFGGYPLERKLKFNIIEKLEEFKNFEKKEIKKLIRGIKVEKENDPLFKGTGLKNNDVFGNEYFINKVELDGSHVIKIINNNHEKKSINTDHDNHLGSTYCVDASGNQKKIGVMVRKNYGEGRVISSGMINWVRSFGDHRVKTITKNMFMELLS